MNTDEIKTPMDLVNALAEADPFNSDEIMVLATIAYGMKHYTSSQNPCTHCGGSGVEPQEDI